MYNADTNRNDELDDFDYWHIWFDYRDRVIEPQGEQEFFTILNACSKWT